MRKPGVIARVGRRTAATGDSRWDLAPAAARARGDEGNRRLVMKAVPRLVEICEFPLDQAATHRAAG